MNLTRMIESWFKKKSMVPNIYSCVHIGKYTTEMSAIWFATRNIMFDHMQTGVMTSSELSWRRYAHEGFWFCSRGPCSCLSIKGLISDETSCHLSSGVCLFLCGRAQRFSLSLSPSLSLHISMFRSQMKGSGICFFILQDRKSNKWMKLCLSKLPPQDSIRARDWFGWAEVQVTHC